MRWNWGPEQMAMMSAVPPVVRQMKQASQNVIERLRKEDEEQAEQGLEEAKQLQK